MPPAKAGSRRGQQASEHLYNLGERGRYEKKERTWPGIRDADLYAHSKTGVTLRDTGARDEYGMQPIDDIFSSPSKANGGSESDDGGEADMDLTTGETFVPRCVRV